MTHAWTTLMAVFFSSMMNVSTEVDQNQSENIWENVEYMAVDRIVDGSCIVEKGGALHILRNMMPKGQLREGDVMQWRISAEDVDRRLAGAHARLERMQTMSVMELNL